MSLDEFAALRSEQGERLHWTNGVWWQVRRGFFWRPLDPFARLDPDTVVLPWIARLGAVLYTSGDTGRCNAVDPVMVHENLREYALERLNDKRKSETRHGIRCLTARPITDVGFFCDHAHGLFLDFHARTGYGYKSDRVCAKAFARWAETLFRHPKAVVLGAFEQEALRAVAVSCRVQETIFEMTFFSDTASLKLHVTDFMLHTIRQAAAATDARRIYRGRQTGNAGVDRAKMVRGCRLLKQPAHLHASRLARWAFRMAQPGLYRRVTGAE